MSRFALRLGIAILLLWALALPGRLNAARPDCGCTVWPTYTNGGSGTSLITPMSTACQLLYDDAVTLTKQGADGLCQSEGFLRSCNINLTVGACTAAPGGGYQRSWSATFGCWVCA